MFLCCCDGNIMFYSQRIFTTKSHNVHVGILRDLVGDDLYIPFTKKS